MDRILEFIVNHYILVLALAVVSYLLVQELLDTAFKKFGNVSPMLAVAKMNEAETVVIDVREPDEFVTGHIENAISMPLSSLPEQLQKLAAYKQTPVLIACKSGARASSAGKILTKAGFENIQVITGGMDAWTDDYKLPIKITSKNKAKTNLSKSL